MSFIRHYAETPLLLMPKMLNQFDQLAVKLFDDPPTIKNGVGVLRVRGVIGPRAEFEHMYFGGTAIELLREHFKALMADNSVHTIVLDIDSPGGFTDNAFSFAEMIYQARSEKKIVAFVNSLAASGAYLLSSAATEIVLEGPDAKVGSIGVIIAHVDMSKAEERWGLKITEVTAGEFKAAASPHAPLDDVGREVLEDHVMRIYNVFSLSAQNYRSWRPEQTKKVANGRVYIGQQAIELGLADKIQSFDSLMLDLSKTTSSRLNMGDENKTQAPKITLEYLQANHSDILSQVKTESFEAGKVEGVKIERQRLNKISTIEQKPAFKRGYEKIFAKAREDGTSPAELSEQLIDAMSDRGVSAEDIEHESPEAVEQTEGPQEKEDLKAAMIAGMKQRHAEMKERKRNG